MKKKPGKIYKVVETINLSELAGILLGCIGIYTYKNSFKINCVPEDFIKDEGVFLIFFFFNPVILAYQDQNVYVSFCFCHYSVSTLWVVTFLDIFSFETIGLQVNKFELN